ncbi:hypothetical protein LTR28_007752, partial [Elasticomyces elasticus]
MAEDEDPSAYVFESDAAAIRAFVREMVAQSIIPSMERLSTTWNDQVASRRRGISGRFMSLSKRWTPFSGRSATGPITGSSGSNFDALQGFYRPEASEAVMRKLADYAFMLRDFKLAQSTYEILCTDFKSDKAWKQYAGANEMAAVTALLGASAMSSKVRSDTIDQMLETAYYSYLTRCTAPYNALRTLTLGLELLRLRGSSATEDAARWASRILEDRLVGPVGHALFTERIAVCLGARKGIGGMELGARRRKAAFFHVLATDAWLRMDKVVQAGKNLSEALRLYRIADPNAAALAMSGMQLFVQHLQRVVTMARSREEDDAVVDVPAEKEAALFVEPVQEESEQLDQQTRRMSLSGVVAPLALDPLGAAPM